MGRAERWQAVKLQGAYCIVSTGTESSSLDVYCIQSARSHHTDIKISKSTVHDVTGNVPCKQSIVSINLQNTLELEMRRRMTRIRSPKLPNLLTTSIDHHQADTTGDKPPNLKHCNGS